MSGTIMQNFRTFYSGIIFKQLILEKNSWNLLLPYKIQIFVWSSLLHRGLLEDSSKIYFMTFGHSYKFLQILEFELISVI
jgi:hypothetical protein